MFEVKLLEDFKVHLVVPVSDATDEEIKACLQEQDVDDSFIIQADTGSKSRKYSAKTLKKVQEKEN